MRWNLGSGLDGRPVLVTGATGGIGVPTTRALAAAGARIAAVDLSKDRVDELVSSLEGDGHLGLVSDLRDPDAHKMLIQRVENRFGALYGLVNIAAILRRQSRIDEVSEEDWDDQHDVNLKAAFFLAREAARSMAAGDRGGRMVLFSSQGWWTGGLGGSIAYSASKGGIVSLARGLARTYGPQGITVNTVAPGQVETRMLLDGLDPAVYQAIREQTPLGYVADPEEMAGPVVFLLSDHARYITGATLNVSGGYLLY